MRWRSTCQSKKSRFLPPPGSDAERWLPLGGSGGCVFATDSLEDDHKLSATLMTRRTRLANSRRMLISRSNATRRD
jgi:hypothetical protein